MNFKKIISLVAAGAFSISAMSVMTSADSIGSASIFLADETWSSQVYWGNGINGNDTIGIADVQPVEITGDGTYTTSVKFNKAMDYGFFFCLSSDIKGKGSGTEGSTFADYPNAEMTITSVKADGKEIAGNTSISDINDNGYIKVNIFDPLTDASENYADSLEWTSGIKSMEVTFTVKGTGILSAEAPEEDVKTESKPSDNVVDGSNGAEDGTADDSTGSGSPADGSGISDESTGGNSPADDSEASGNSGGTSADNGDAPADDNGTSADDGDTAADNGGSPADESASGEAEENVPADGSTVAPDTGNAPMSPMAAVTALAAFAMFMTRKKSK